MKKTSFLLSTVLMLAGCVVAPAAPVISTQLTRLQGQPAGAVFARLGYPNGESMVAGTKFYFWSNNGVAMVPTTYETTTTTWVGKKAITSDQTTFGPEQAVPYGCTIRLFVDPNETIISHDFRGDQNGCAVFAQKLDPTYDPRPHSAFR
jgi:hypothetical protein